MSIFLTVLFIIAVIILMAAVTYFLYYYNLRITCDQDPNYWCFNDWQCARESDPKKQFPAKTLYCNTGDFNFCSILSNQALPACVCNLGRTSDGCLPDLCTCEWGSSGTSPLGACGAGYCSAGNVQACTG
jgi:hypothetical protein